jgi:hypothetical protein
MRMCIGCNAAVDESSAGLVTMKRTPGGTIIPASDRQRFWLCHECWSLPACKETFAAFSAKTLDPAAK